MMMLRRYVALAGFLFAFAGSALALTPATELLLFGGGNYVAASINFASGAASGLGCASLSACIADTRSTTATYVTPSGGLATAAVNTPRIDCSNATCGLLNEAASTNLITQSGSFSSWSSLNGGSVGTSSVLAPDGASYYALVTQGQTSSGAANNGGVASPYASVSAGVPYTLSMFIYEGTAPYVTIQFSDNSANGGQATFSLATGAYSSYSTFGGASIIGTPAILSLSGGLLRLSFTIQSTAWASSHFLVHMGPASDASNDSVAGQTVDVFSAQIEQNSFASSSIPTTTGPVTRSADAMSAAGNLAAAMAAGQSYVDAVNNSTKAASRTLYAANAYTWPTGYTVTQICAYKPSVSAGYLSAHSTPGTGC